VDPETHPHQNGIWSYKLSLHRETDIIKNVFYWKAVVKQDHNMEYFLSLGCCLMVGSKPK
jgi:hypothetical protein